MSGGESKLVCQGCDYVSEINDIPDLLVKILSYLPVNSVLRCKLVCKLWFHLIKDPQFAQLQFNSSTKAPTFILHLSPPESDPEVRNSLCLMDIDGEVSPYVTLPPTLYKDCSLRLISSFNGLLFFTKLVGDGDLGVVVCNPATRRVMELPEGSSSAMTPSVGVLTEPGRNKYMVFRFFSNEQAEETCYKYEVYKPEEGVWGRAYELEQGPVANLACPFFPTYLCVGGRIYWLVWGKEDPEAPDYILCLDVDGNLGEVKLPETDRMSFNLFTFLVDCGGCLGLVCVCDDETCLFVWSLTDHETSSWSLHGGVELCIHSTIESINSIVSVGQELLFIMKPALMTFFCFKFLNVEDLTWRDIYSRFEIDECEPVAFLHNESLF